MDKEEIIVDLRKNNVKLILDDEYFQCLILKLKEDSGVEIFSTLAGLVNITVLNRDTIILKASN